MVLLFHYHRDYYDTGAQAALVARACFSNESNRCSMMLSGSKFVATEPWSTLGDWQRSGHNVLLIVYPLIQPTRTGEGRTGKRGAQERRGGRQRRKERKGEEGSKGSRGRRAIPCPPPFKLHFFTRAGCGSQRLRRRIRDLSHVTVRVAVPWTPSQDKQSVSVIPCDDPSL